MNGFLMGGMFVLGNTLFMSGWFISIKGIMVSSV